MVTAATQQAGPRPASAISIYNKTLSLHQWRCIRSRPIACFFTWWRSGHRFSGGISKYSSGTILCANQNFVINPSHCFACLVGVKLQSIDSTLRLELKEFGPRFFGRCFIVSFVDYTLCQSNFGKKFQQDPPFERRLINSVKN
jgi:hypothetical protein